MPGLPTPPDLAEPDRPRAGAAADAGSEPRGRRPSGLRVGPALHRASRGRPPDFEVTNENAAAVAAICARLHGMPLAIELAAARVKAAVPRRDPGPARRTSWRRSPAGARDLPERQQTLRGAIAWSYDILDEGDRRLLERLSVFRGGIDLEAAEAVCGPAEELGRDVVDGLGELADQSLLRVIEGAEARFQMLETIREFAADLLASRGEADPCAAVPAWFLGLAGSAAPQLAGRRPARAGSIGSSRSTTTSAPLSTAPSPTRTPSPRSGSPSPCGASGRCGVTCSRRVAGSTPWRPPPGRAGRRSCAPG